MTPEQKQSDKAASKYATKLWGGPDKNVDDPISYQNCYIDFKAGWDARKKFDKKKVKPTTCKQVTK